MLPGRYSRLAKSSGDRTSAPAARFSTRWSGLPVPGMASRCGPRLRVHAIRTCAGCRAVRTRDGLHCRVGGHAAGLTSVASDREERHERDTLVAAGTHELVVHASGVDTVRVLHADHRGDRLRLCEVLRANVGQAEMPDETGVAQFGQRAEVLRDRVQSVLAQVHHIQMVTAELAQVLLDLPAQLVRPGQRQPFPRGVAARPDLGRDDQVIGVRRQRTIDQLIGRPERREVERRRVDVVHAELDRPAQHADGPRAVARRASVARQAHRAESDPVDGQVAEGPGASGTRTDHVRGHWANLATAADLRSRSSARYRSHTIVVRLSIVGSAPSAAQ